jgi:hypothetical protein
MVEPDTYLPVPGPSGSAAFMIKLRLDVPNPDLSGLDELLTSRALDRLEAVLHEAEQPYPWAAQHVLHAITHLRLGEYDNAWPPLVIGLEGLFWAVAERDGFIDANGRFTAKAGRSGKPRSAIEIVGVLPLNERVKNVLRREAFGGGANEFRHGRQHQQGTRKQCELWLLALVMWISAWGWDAAAKRVLNAAQLRPADSSKTPDSPE